MMFRRYARAAVRFLVFVICLYGVSSIAQAQDQGEHNEVFFETFIVRCMTPAHAGFEYNTENMTQVKGRIAEHWLDGGPGSVWSPKLSLKVLLIIRGDGSCMVVSAFGDARSMETKVASWFDAKSSPFKRDRFERAPGGGFEAMYFNDCAPELRCRVIINARGEPLNGQLALLAMAGRVRR